MRSVRPCLYNRAMRYNRTELARVSWRPIPRPIRPTARPEAPAPVTVAVVHVRGRRVAWSLTATWSPLASGKIKAYQDAAQDGLAGVQRGGVVDLVRTLLRLPGVKGVMVHGTGGDRMVYATTPPDGGSIRSAWSETSSWSPFEDARTSAGRAARSTGFAGVETGLEGLIRALSVPELCGELNPRPEPRHEP